MAGSPVRRARKLAQLAAQGVDVSKEMEQLNARITGVARSPLLETAPRPEPKPPRKPQEAPPRPKVAVQPGLAATASAALLGAPRAISATDEQKFTELQGLALDRALEIIALPIREIDEYTGSVGPVDMKLVGIQKELIASVLTTTVRTDAGKLKGASGDPYAGWLAELKAKRESRN
jgi:hypothetical protein